MWKIWVIDIALYLCSVENWTFPGKWSLDLLLRASRPLPTPLKRCYVLEGRALLLSTGVMDRPEQTGTQVHGKWLGQKRGNYCTIASLELKPLGCCSLYGGRERKRFRLEYLYLVKEDQEEGIKNHNVASTFIKWASFVPVFKRR